MVKELKIPEGFQKTDAGIIPNDWVVKPLHEVAHFENGKAHEQFIDEHGDYVVVNSKFISTEGRVKKFSKKNIFPLKKSDITIVMSDIPKGKALAKCFLIDKDDTYTLNQRIGGITANDDTDNKYLFYKLNRNKYYLAFDSGTGQTNIKRQQILDCPIALPPTKSEQCKISIALKDLDNLLDGCNKILKKKIAIKHDVEQKLLSGEKRLTGYNSIWQEESIESLCKIFTKQTGFDYSAYIKPALIDNYEEGAIPFIQNKDFNGKNINFYTDYFIPVEVAKKFPKILLDEKCLLISISGSVGNVGLFQNKQIAFLGGAIAVGKFKDKAKLDWVMHYLQSNIGQKMLLNKVKAGSHKNLILQDIRKLKVLIPDALEQTAVTRVISDMDAEIMSLKAKTSKYQLIKKGMSHALLNGKKRLI